MLNKLINLSLLLLLSLGCFSPVAKEIQPSLLEQGNEQHNNLIKHLSTLSSDFFSGRKFATADSFKAQKYIINELKKTRVKPFQHKYQHSFLHETLFYTKQGHNIIGIIEGTENTEHFIVLTAHYDHLGQKSQKTYNGADDNASGVAALLYLAEKLSQQPAKHSIIFLFTDAEEVNLLGVKAFIAQQKALLSKIKLNINLDMIAGNKHTRYLHFIDKNLGRVFNETALVKFKRLQAELKLKKGFTSKLARGANRRQWYEASDHSAFYHLGIAFIYFGVGTHKNYHTPNDTYENINLDFYIYACQAIYQQLRFIDKHIE